MHGEYRKKARKIFDFSKNYDVVTLQETWLYQHEHMTAQLPFANHTVISSSVKFKPRNMALPRDARYKEYGGRQGQGVILAIKSPAIPLRQHVSEDGRFIVARFYIRGYTYIIATIYAPVSDTTHFQLSMDKFTKSIQSMYTLGDCMIITGDWNSVELAALDRHSGINVPSRDDIMRDTVDRLHITDTYRVVHRHNQEWSRYGPTGGTSRIDRIYVYTQHAQDIVDANIIKTDGSDHFPVTATLAAPQYQNQEDDSVSTQYRWQVRGATEETYDALGKALKEQISIHKHDWDTACETDDSVILNEKLAVIRRIALHALADTFEQSEIRSRQSKPKEKCPIGTLWWTDVKHGLTYLKRMCNNAINRNLPHITLSKRDVELLRSSPGTEENNFTFPHCPEGVENVIVPTPVITGEWRQQVLDALKIARSEACKQQLLNDQRSQAEFTDRLFQETTASVSRFYNRVRSKQRNAGPPRLVKDSNGNLLHQPASVRAAMKEYYARLFNTKHPRPTFAKMDWDVEILTSPQRDTVSTSILLKIKRKDINGIALKLDPTRAPGPDTIPPGVWKYMPAELCTLVKSLFNDCIRIKNIPAAWLKGHVYSVHKTGDMADLNNYRPITLLDTLYKIFSRIITFRTSEATEQQHVFSKAQKGFRKRQSIPSHHRLFSSLCEHARLNKSELYALYIDIIKAFDSAQH